MHDTIEIRRLAPGLPPELLACLAGDAFAGDPKWRSCGRPLPLVDPAAKASATPAADASRASACGRIGGDRRPAGWPLEPRRAHAFALDRHQR